MRAHDNTPTDAAQIRRLIERWAKSVRAKHMEGILANHAPDIVFFDVPPPVQSQGLDAYRKSWEQFFPWFGTSGVFEISELRIAAGDDVAFCHGLIRCGGMETSGESCVGGPPDCWSPQDQRPVDGRA